jgi:hypothetical protein
MTLLARWTSALACVFLTTAALDAGGWAVITVVRTPDTVVAGEPVTVTYKGRNGSWTANYSALTVRAETVAYVAK